MRQLVSAVVLLPFLLLLSTPCTIRTDDVPIPPGGCDLISFELDPVTGTARFKHGPNPSYANATVYVFNRNRGAGIVTAARADGSVGPFTFVGIEGDEIVITFVVDELQGSICLILRPGSCSGLECDR